MAVLSAVSSSVKHGYFIFGEQEVTFKDVTPREDMILIVRFYHWPGGSTASSPWHHRRNLEPLLASEEWAAAWTVLRLTKPASSKARTGPSDPESSSLEWNAGTHDLALYHCPAPPVQNLHAILPEHYEKMFEQYGGARIRLCVFGGSRPEFPFPPESPTTEAQTQEAPEAAYIPLSRAVPVSEPYSSKDAIDLYIDGARFLPDAVTVTQVTGRIFDKNFEQFGPDISCDADLDSDIFHPFYNYLLQIRSLNLPPTATLLLKVYTIDRFTKGLSLIGWAALNLFVESGSQKAPTSNSEEVKISLNKGAHQIRVYRKPPPTDRPFSAASLASSGRIVPCATLLVRVMRASDGNNQQPAQKGENIPQTIPRPEYSHRVYFSDSAQPTKGEIELYRSMINRSAVTVEDVILLLAGSSRGGLMSNRELSQWAQKIFAQKKDQMPPPFMLCCVSRYRLMSGVKVSVDRAQNLPWSGLTLGHVCLNPPGAFYFGHPWVKYDRPVPVENIDLNSNQNCPAWNDGFKTFTWRMFNEHLTVIFQLHEILLQKEKENTRSGPEPTKQVEGASVLAQGAQAWTALRVFYKHYCNTGAYRLPLYHGAPSPEALRALGTEDCRVALKNMEQKQAVRNYSPPAEQDPRTHTCKR
ncbi:uncharacterized protein LOC128500966 [Spea bombifrons]|uniref:uncharacterized protein LOC128500966 n=1 Tax=Spea bombifrons TaxID=233779 RepID=UPI00234B0AA7|nr:uncharacterized protein LOC128500966 [Spea bombifrons]